MHLDQASHLKSESKVRPVEWNWLEGPVPYERAREIQLELVEKRIRDEIPDTFLALEHTPVVTRGRGLQRKLSQSQESEPSSDLRAMPLIAPLPQGIAYSESERGGDLTYHAPGQLVIYPIVKLDGGAPWAPHHDISGFLRWLERSVARVLEGQGLETEARADATGVWCRCSRHQSGQAQDFEASAVEFKKIASIGIAVRRWVTYHGVAINLTNDLAPFSLISPCGFSSEVMTSYQALNQGKDFKSLGISEFWNFWKEGF